MDIPNYATSGSEKQENVANKFIPHSGANGHVSGIERAQDEFYFDISKALAGVLTTDHRTKLQIESGLSDAAIDTRGYFTCDDKSTFKLLGFEANIGRSLIIPLYNHRGERVSCMARPDIPFSKRSGKAPKYLMPKGAAQVVDVAPLTHEYIDDPQQPLFVTEGAKKADAAASNNLCCINLNGVFGFRGINEKGGIANLAAFDSIAFTGKAESGEKYGRIVYIVFDSDVTENTSVENALRRFCALVSARGAVVKIIRLKAAPNGDKTGLDDFFARDKGTKEMLFMMARDLESENESKRRKKAEKVEAKLNELSNRGLPNIETNDGQLSDRLGEFATAVGQFNSSAPTLFNSAYGLTEIGKNAKGESVLRAVARERMQVIASKAATWISTTEREGPRDVTPPRDFCTQFLVSPDAWQNIPNIERILTAPFVDRHGSVCATPGYHESEQIWLSLPYGFSMPETTPTQSNVEAAKNLLLHTLLGEVAFADQASRANALALLLLPFVQRTIDGFTPLHLFDAPTQSSGKTYAAQICIAPFREIAPSAYKKNNEENQKELFARLMSGPSHIFTDNITGDMSDPTLATAITEKYLDGRVMGMGRTEVVSTRVVWVGTSNNAQLCSDAVSRSVLIRLDTRQENPEQRQFKLKPVRYIAQHRAEVLGAIFTLIRAWLEVGRPISDQPTRSRFDEWEQIMGGILETIGIKGFLDNHLEARAEMNTEAAAWGEFAIVWHHAHGSECVSSKKLLESALKCDELSALIGSKDGQATRFSRMLQQRKNKIFAGFTIIRSEQRGASGVKWRILPPKTP
jgi:hypothetical protein